MEKAWELESEGKEKMCSFYAYGLTCPDYLEFNNCCFQHDEIVLQAFNTRFEKNLSQPERAKKALKLLLLDTTDEDVIGMRKKLLRFWPTPPSDNMKK